MLSLFICFPRKLTRKFFKSCPPPKDFVTDWKKKAGLSSYSVWGLGARLF